MRLTTKGRYAVTAMLDLVLHEQKGPVTLMDIADNQEISLSYLEQLFAKLRKSGLVKGMRGPGGGYRLGKAAQEISIADIISAVDEKFDARRCGGGEGCQDGERCLTHELWCQLSEHIHTFLNGINLLEVAKWSAVQETVARQDDRSSAAHPANLHILPMTASGEFNR